LVATFKRSCGGQCSLNMSYHSFQGIGVRNAEGRNAPTNSQPLEGAGFRGECKNWHVWFGFTDPKSRHPGPGKDYNGGYVLILCHVAGGMGDDDGIIVQDVGLQNVVVSPIG